MSVPRQIWESLISMVKVYAHAAGLNGIPCVVTTRTEAAQVTRKGCTLTITYSAETGAGDWRLKHGDCEEWGEFRIDEHGALVFPAGAKELDTAAIDWIDQLVHVGECEANDLSSTPERARSSYVAALDPTADPAEETGGSAVVPLDNSPVLTEQL